MGGEERRGQTILEELFRFSRNALSASAVSLCWSEPDRGGGAPEIVGIDRAFLKEYFRHGIAIDPVLINYNYNRKYVNLAQIVEKDNVTSNISDYISFISKYNYHDETNFFLEFEGHRLAVLTLFAETALALDPNLLTGLHSLMSSLVANHPVPRQRRRRRIYQSAYNLTTREIDVAELVREGASNQDIRQRLGISLATVKTHISRVLDKVAVDSRSALAATANHL